jgi:hypothetical protein
MLLNLSWAKPLGVFQLQVSENQPQTSLKSKWIYYIIVNGKSRGRAFFRHGLIRELTSIL